MSVIGDRLSVTGGCRVDLLVWSNYFFNYASRFLSHRIAPDSLVVAIFKTAFLWLCRVSLNAVGFDTLFTQWSGGLFKFL
jgi:hypothetical protein